ncbi:IS110 family transposase [Spirochaetia bacterium]|nr:IS110 family transposase [Spirochaetia bacterium]
MRSEERRYVGIDLGKRTWVMMMVKRTGKLVKNARGEEEPEEKLGKCQGKTTAEGRAKLYQKLKSGDKVALEAGNLAFIMAKELEQAVGCEIRVLNPSHLAIIYATDKKTDPEDALKLAHLLTDRPDSRLPIVPVPSDEEMARRKVLASYAREQRVRNQGINRLHALFVHQGITTVVRKDLATKGNREATVGQLTGLEREEAEHLMACLSHYEARIAALEKRMAEQAEGDEQIERLQTVPGVGPKVSFAFSAYVQAERFANAAQVSNYLGLVPRVSMSGTIVRYGRITKRGNGYLRALLVQAAWAVTWSRNGGALRERYEYMTGVKGIGKKKAIVAIARRLAVVMYTLLKNGTEYEVRHLEIRKRPEKTAVLAQEALSA